MTELGIQERVIREASVAALAEDAPSILHVVQRRAPEDAGGTKGGCRGWRTCSTRRCPCPDCCRWPGAGRSTSYRGYPGCCRRTEGWSARSWFHIIRLVLHMLPELEASVTCNASIHKASAAVRQEP